MLFKQLLHENQLRLNFLKLFLIHSVMKQGALQDTSIVRIPFTSVCMHTCKRDVSVHVMFSKLPSPHSSTASNAPRKCHNRALTCRWSNSCWKILACQSVRERETFAPVSSCALIFTVFDLCNQHHSAQHTTARHSRALCSLFLPSMPL